MTRHTHIGLIIATASAVLATSLVAQRPTEEGDLRKIVVTDDDGRFLVPELPGASYEVWVRGYGLVDSAPVTVGFGA